MSLAASRKGQTQGKARARLPLRFLPNRKLNVQTVRGGDGAVTEGDRFHRCPQVGGGFAMHVHHRNARRRGALRVRESQIREGESALIPAASKVSKSEKDVSKVPKQRY